MKNRNVLLTVVVFLGMISGLKAQSVPSYVPTNGLVGWWPFNGNANDESGNGNNGTVNGATLTADRFGNPNKSFSFNGTNASITIPHSQVLNFSDYSVSLWFNKTGQGINNLQNWFVLLRKGIAQPYTIWVNKDTARIGGNLNNGTIFKEIYSSTISVEQSWYNVTLTYSSLNNGTWSLYINGHLENQVLNIGTPANNSDPINIGGGNFSSVISYFKGLIDDIAIYNRALSQQEITALYQGGNTSANCLDLPTNLQQGLVGYWPFCGNALDESGNGNHGTVNGATPTTDRFGNAGSAYSFDGLNDNISVADNPSLNLTDKLTLSAWFYEETFKVEQPLLGKGRNDNQTGYTILHRVTQTNDASGMSLVNNLVYNEIFTTEQSIFDLGVWHQVVGTYDGNIGRLYIDGVLVNTVTNQMSLIYNMSTLLYFGHEVQGGHTRFFKGSLDDIAIWHRALTPQEITQLYNQGICKTSITVTDTLLIHTGITSYNPVAYQNTLKVWPNPGNQDITIDAGNLALMQGWKIRVSNAQGVQIYPSGSQSGLINQQQQTLDMSSWGGNGLYFLYLIDPQNNIQEVKKIVLAP